MEKNRKILLTSGSSGSPHINHRWKKIEISMLIRERKNPRNSHIIFLKKRRKQLNRLNYQINKPLKLSDLYNLRQRLHIVICTGSLSSWCPTWVRPCFGFSTRDGLACMHGWFQWGLHQDSAYPPRWWWGSRGRGAAAASPVAGGGEGAKGGRDGSPEAGGG